MRCTVGRGHPFTFNDFNVLRFNEFADNFLRDFAAYAIHKQLNPTGTRFQCRVLCSPCDCLPWASLGVALTRGARLFRVRLTLRLREGSCSSIGGTRNSISTSGCSGIRLLLHRRLRMELLLLGCVALLHSRVVCIAIGRHSIPGMCERPVSWDSL